MYCREIDFLETPSQNQNERVVITFFAGLKEREITGSGTWIDS